MEKQLPAQDDFKQRRGGAGQLRVWLWTQDPRITIRERINGSGGVGYRVTLPKGVTGGKVVFLQSRNLEDAKSIARTKGREFRESRSTAMVLGDAEKIQAASALKALKEQGIALPLDEVVRQFCRASSHLVSLGMGLEAGVKLLAEAMKLAATTGKPLIEVVDFAAKRLRPENGTKTLTELTVELIEIKRGWLARGDLRPTSFADFADRASKIADEIGSFPLPDLTKQAIYDWLKGLKLAPRTTKNYRMILAELLRYAEQKRYLMGNPMEEFTRQDLKEIEGNHGSTRQPAILSPKQAENLLISAFRRPELDLGAAVVLGLFGGIRTEELKRLTWDAVRLDEEHPFVVIGPEIAKKRRIRNVPLPECAVAWLQAWPRSAKITRSAHANDYQKRFKKLCKDAKIVWDTNAMRHSFGSYHYAAHSNSIETSRILGHKSDDSVLFAHYRALTTKAQGEAFFKLMPPKIEGVIPFPVHA